MDCKSTKYLITIILITLSAGAYAASVYKCVDSEGNVRFSDSPVCRSKQPYATAEPVLKVNIKSMATKPDAGRISLNFKDTELKSMLELLSEFAGIPIVNFVNEEKLISVAYQNLPWENVFDDLVRQHDLSYRKAYNHIYIYKNGGTGDTITNNPDLLRWFQSDSQWKAVSDQEKAIIENPKYQDLTTQERLPILIPRVKEMLGEPPSGNYAEHTGITDSYRPPATSDTAWDINRRYLDNLEEQRRKTKALETQTELLRQQADRERRERRRAKRFNCTTLHTGSESYTNCR